MMKAHNFILTLTVVFVAVATLCAVLVCPVALAQSAASSAQAAANGGGTTLKPHVVAAFNNDWNSSFEFLESITAGPDGNLYVSVTDWGATGYPSCPIVRLTPEGKHREVFASLDPNICPAIMQTGVAFDEKNRVHVAGVSFQPDGLSGVYRANDDGTMTQVLRTPDGSFPNGLAFYDGDMYVSDLNQGFIYRKRPRDPVAAAAPWFQNPTFTAPNGIAFYRDTLYVALTWAGEDADGNQLGSIVRIHLRHDGSPGEYEVVAPPDPRLYGLDGIAFDVTGKLWFTIASGNNGSVGKLGTMDEDGRVQILADTPGWLDYPTQAVFGTSMGTRDRLFLTNGGLSLGQPGVLSLKVRVAGVELPAQ
jgi:sugar lactone lactonase YvrE